MMATFESITWQAVGVIAMMLSALATAVVWTFNKVYRLGKTDQRITNIEYILDVEFREKFKSIDKRFNKIDDRFDRIDAKFDKLYDLLLKKQ
jgi:hypothetical protein